MRENMTIVELIDAAPIHNIMGALAFNATKIIYVGTVSKEKYREQYEGTIKRFFAAKGIENIETEYLQVIRNDFNDIKAKFEKIAEENPHCYFDISGGEDVMLAVAGYIFLKNQNVHLYQVNPNTNRIYLFSNEPDRDGSVKTVKKSIAVDIRNSVEENMIAHGGKVVYDDVKRDATHRWKYTVPFLNDLEVMWDICCTQVIPNPNDDKKLSPTRLWNTVTIALYNLEMAKEKTDNPLEFILDTEKYKTHLNLNGGYYLLDKYLNLFEQKGLIKFGDTHSRERIHIIYKDEQVKLCLTKAGTILEMKTFLTCEALISDKFTDCMTGVTVDWDGIVHKEADPQSFLLMSKEEQEQIIEDTVNEIDIVLMKGAIPYFISCKNGKFDADELNKMYVVRDKFGKEYGRMIIVTTDFDKFTGGYTLEHLRQRAKDMGIDIIENVHEMTDEEFRSKLEAALLR